MVELKQNIEEINTCPYVGRVSRITGLVIEAEGIVAAVGELCKISDENFSVAGEVVGFSKNITYLMPLGEIYNLKPGARVYTTGRCMSVGVGESLISRVVDALGNPLDLKGPIFYKKHYPVYAPPPAPVKRKRIESRLETGVKVIDGLVTIGEGQRVGLFAGSGVGKSTLVGMIAKNSKADINVVALIGERGREVREFIEKDLGSEGIKKSVVVVSTSEQPSMLRIKAAFTATAIAEYFRDMGMKVMLFMDSVTRFAMAQREVGLSVGEPPTVKGYPPSVFALLPKILERAGQGENGSITGIYSVLVDGDDHNEPIADAVRGILDGHIVLSRELAHKNHYPAVDVLFSLSRLMPDIADEKHLKTAMKIRDIMAVYKQYEDMIKIGAYSKGANQELDNAMQKIPLINNFLKQGIKESYSLKETLKLMEEAVK
ncbi:MAG: flagellar protein export ATPase FliI [Elusimicrobiales bacterium]